MSGRPTLGVVHNNIDGRSAIGAIARWAVRAGLERGWDVTVVCRDLDPELAPHVTRRSLYVPPRLHLLQWSVARPTVRRALAGWRPDALLVYQPQVAAIADVWHVQYLSRAARRAGMPRRPGLRGTAADAQAAGVAVLEDRYLRRLPAATRVLFCSDGLRDQHAELFAPIPDSGVLYNPALLSPAPRHAELPDTARRAQVTGGHTGPVVGFLGGADPRKGGDLVVAAVAADPDLFLVHAGPTRLDDATLRGRSRDVGHLRDVTELLDVIDVLLVPSRFEPFGLVVAEAAARGVPVLVGAKVGAAPLVVECGAGAVWSPSDPLGPAVADLIGRRTQIAAGGRELVQRLDPVRLADELFAELEAAAERRTRSRA
jgi:glycosyltransferase involved in cell wall biosynthesis